MCFVVLFGGMGLGVIPKRSIVLLKALFVDIFQV